MARTTNKKPGESAGGATVGYEAQPWQMADALRGSMDAAEYKHVCLGLLFLKYSSDASRRSTPRCWPRRPKAPTPKTPTSPAPRAFSGCRPRRAGRT